MFRCTGTQAQRTLRAMHRQRQLDENVSPAEHRESLPLKALNAFPERNHDGLISLVCVSISFPEAAMVPF